MTKNLHALLLRYHKIFVSPSSSLSIRASDKEVHISEKYLVVQSPVQIVMVCIGSDCRIGCLTAAMIFMGLINLLLITYALKICQSLTNVFL